MKKIFTLACAILAFTLTHAQFTTGVSITLRVDMTNYLQNSGTLDPNGVHVAGDFHKDSLYTAMPTWTPSSPAGLLTQVGTTNIYGITINLKPNDTILYKFVNGIAWGTCHINQECLTLGMPCVLPDASNRPNRGLLTGKKNVTYTFCWDSCVQCNGKADTLFGTNVTNINADFTHFSTNYSNGILNIYYTSNYDVNSSIVITNMLGETLKTYSSTYLNYGAHTEKINVAGLAAGMYLVSLKSEGGIITRKFIVTK